VQHDEGCSTALQAMSVDSVMLAGVFFFRLLGFYPTALPGHSRQRVKRSFLKYILGKMGRLYILINLPNAPG